MKTQTIYLQAWDQKTEEYTSLISHLLTFPNINQMRFRFENLVSHNYLYKFFSNIQFYMQYWRTNQWVNCEYNPFCNPAFSDISIFQGCVYFCFHLLPTPYPNIPFKLDIYKNGKWIHSTTPFFLKSTKQKSQVSVSPKTQSCLIPPKNRFSMGPTHEYIRTEPLKNMSCLRPPNVVLPSSTDKTGLNTPVYHTIPDHPILSYLQNNPSISKNVSTPSSETVVLTPASTSSFQSSPSHSYFSPSNDLQSPQQKIQYEKNLLEYSMNIQCKNQDFISTENKEHENKTISSPFSTFESNLHLQENSSFEDHFLTSKLDFDASLLDE